MKKSISLLSMITLSSISYGQKFKNALESVTDETKTWIEPLETFLYVMVVVVGLYGVFKIYGKIQTGDQDTGKSIAQWIGGIIFLVAAILILKALQN